MSLVRHSYIVRYFLVMVIFCCIVRYFLVMVIFCFANTTAFHMPDWKFSKWGR